MGKMRKRAKPGLDEKPINENISLPEVSMENNPFNNIHIDTTKLTTCNPSLPAVDDNDDARSVITSKSFRGLKLSKKAKANYKKDFWTKKMELQTAEKEEKKQQSKRNKTVITGDLNQLADALPTLELLMKDVSKHQRLEPRVPKMRSHQTIKKRKKSMIKDLTLFKQVMQNKEYKKDPFASITQHLINKQKLEDETTKGK